MADLAAPAQAHVAERIDVEVFDVDLAGLVQALGIGRVLQVIRDLSQVLGRVEDRVDTLLQSQEPVKDLVDVGALLLAQKAAIRPAVENCRVVPFS